MSLIDPIREILQRELERGVQALAGVFDNAAETFENVAEGLKRDEAALRSNASLNPAEASEAQTPRQQTPPSTASAITSSLGRSPSETEHNTSVQLPHATIEHKVVEGAVAAPANSGGPQVVAAKDNLELDVSRPLTDHQIGTLSPDLFARGFNVEALLQSIKDCESSGGHYRITNSENAMGAYQFLPGTAWSVLNETCGLDRHFGGSTDPSFRTWFLAHPGVQDLAAIGYVREAVLKYHAATVEDVGAFWLGGPGGLSHRDDIHDRNGTTPRRHGNNINNAYSHHLASHGTVAIHRSDDAATAISSRITLDSSTGPLEHADPHTPHLGLSWEQGQTAPNDEHSAPDAHHSS